jgi:DNA polymerase-3 subunit gamma/tau
MADPATPDPVIPEAAAPGDLDAAGVRRVWDEIVAMVRVSNKKIAALASEATVRDIDGDTLVLTFRHAFHARTLAENPEAVVDAIYEVLGGRWQIRCELAGDQRGASGPPPARPAATREPSGTASAAGASPPGRERGGREHSSNGDGDSGASGDRSDEDHQAARSAIAAEHGGRPGTNVGSGPLEDDRDQQRSGRPAQDADAGVQVAPAENGANHADVGDGTDETAQRRPRAADDRPDDRTPGRPDGSGRPSAASSNGPERRDTVIPADDEDDWPETALPGGQFADAGDSDWPETTAPTFAVPQARNEPAESPGPVVAATATATISAAVAAPRPAKTAPGSVGAAAAARAAARAAAGGRPKPAAPQADVEFAGEPPFDPDYDGPAKGVERKAKFEGFDPGDEPTDEVIDERIARQSSEQQAFALLHEALGAERIGEIDLK